MTVDTFLALSTTLDADESLIDTAAAAVSAQILYNQATGLFYDADGVEFWSPPLFAQVVPGTAITAASFDVIVPTPTA